MPASVRISHEARSFKPETETYPRPLTLLPPLLPRHPSLGLSPSLLTLLHFISHKVARMILKHKLLNFEFIQIMIITDFL